MFKIKFKRRIKSEDFKTLTPPGAAPGTIKVPEDSPKPVITTMAFNNNDFVEGAIESLEDLDEVLQEWAVTWVNVTGLGDAKKLKELGRICNLHSLALEDVVNTDQRPKVEDYESNLFIVTKMLHVREKVLCSEQLSLFLASNYLVTFQSKEGDCLDQVRSRIRKTTSKIRKSDADYLAYSIVDAVVDAYFPVLEVYGEQLEQLETKILKDPNPGLVAELHEVKRSLLVLRRNIWPMREAINSMIRDHYPPVSEETKLYLRDCYDHAVRIIELIESYRQIASDLMDLYMSTVSNKMNEVMKVLTIISTLFIPPTFIAGVYGMNFNTEVSPWNMPELNSRFGYAICLTAMAFVSCAVLSFLYSKGWMRSK